MKERSALIELLEEGEVYYDAQYGEAKIVANVSCCYFLFSKLFSVYEDTLLKYHCNFLSHVFLKSHYRFEMVFCRLIKTLDCVSPTKRRSLMSTVRLCRARPRVPPRTLRVPGTRLYILHNNMITRTQSIWIYLMMKVKYYVALVS